MTKNKLIIILSVLVACLFVALLYLLSLNNQKTVSRDVINHISTPSPIPTSNHTDWKTYENKELGFSFEYPSNLSVTEEYRHGETGQAFFLNLSNSQKEIILAGGISSDFSAGRSGTFFDNQGYRQYQQNYFCRFVNTRERPLASPLLDKVSQNNYSVEILYLTGQAKGFEDSGPCDPNFGYLGALINLPGQKIKGLGFIYNPEESIISKNDFSQILSTFKFISP